ncbi:MAG: murein biosynthesis integral membrane protein MurJ, partial [Actinomycetota bacterium]
ARLGAWALSYAGGYQAGLIVVLILANRIEGGFAAYQWAFTFFYLPHALFGVPIFNVLFTAMSEHVVAEEPSRVADRLRSGLGMLGFLLLPISIALVVLAQPLTEVTLDYGVMTEEGARLVGRVLAAFAVGLPTYSAYLVFTRAFYSFGDTRTPAVINLVTVVCSSVVGVAAFFYAPEGWEVAGLAAGHSLGSIVGCALSLRELRGKIGPILERRVLSGLAACMVMAVTAGGLMVALRSATSGSSALWSLLISGASGAVLYLAIAASSRRPEVVRLAGVVRGLLGRGGVR